MIAFFVNYSTIAFPLHLPTLKRQQFFGAVANSLGKKSYFPLPLDVRRCVAPTDEEVDARQLKGSELVYAQWVARGLACYFTAEFATVFLNSAARVFKANLDSQHA